MTNAVKLVCLSGLLLACVLRSNLAPAQQPARTTAGKRPGKAPTTPISTARPYAHADSLVLRARALVARYQDADALQTCKLALTFSPLHYEALWRASELSCRVGQRFTDETRREHYFENARAYAARALDVHPGFAQANYAMALAITSLGTLSTLRTRLATRLEALPYLEAALASDPCYADAWQLMGHWQFKVANYSLLEKIASQLLVGAVPGGATNARAIEAMRRAIEYNPGRVQYYYDLGQMYYLRHRRSAAVQVLEEAQMLNPVTNEELAIMRQCQALIRRIEGRDE